MHCGLEAEDTADKHSGRKYVVINVFSAAICQLCILLHIYWTCIPPAGLVDEMHFVLCVCVCVLLQMHTSRTQRYAYGVCTRFTALGNFPL